MWSLSWDDSIDGKITGDSRRTLLQLSFDGNKVNGTFVGLVMGEARQDRFGGELLGGDHGHVLVLRQTEEEYVACYQAMLGHDGAFIGVWHDSVGRSGDFRLERRKRPA